MACLCLLIFLAISCEECASGAGPSGTLAGDGSTNRGSRTGRVRHERAHKTTVRRQKDAHRRTTIPAACDWPYKRHVYPDPGASSSLPLTKPPSARTSTSSRTAHVSHMNVDSLPVRPPICASSSLVLHHPTGHPCLTATVPDVRPHPVPECEIPADAVPFFSPSTSDKRQDTAIPGRRVPQPPQPAARVPPRTVPPDLQRAEQ